MAIVNIYEGGMDIVEAETEVGTFLGQPLYRAAYSIVAGPNGATVQIPHSIVGLGLMVDVWAMLTNGVEQLHLPHVGGAGDVSLSFDATNVNVTSSGDYSGFAGGLVLFYTKA